MKNLIYSLFYATLLNACNQDPALPIKIEDLKKTEFDDKNIIITGYARVPGSVYGNETENSFGLVMPQEEDSIEDDNYRARCYIKAGEDENQMKALSSGYGEEDFEITDANGQKIHNLERVEITGKLSNLDGTEAIGPYINVSSIVKK